MRWRIIITPFCFWVLLISSGCDGWIGRQIVTAPNQYRSLDDLLEQEKSKEYRAQYWGVDQSFRWEVGQPPESMSVWVIEPRHTWVMRKGTIWYEAFSKGFEQKRFKPEKKPSASRKSGINFVICVDSKEKLTEPPVAWMLKSDPNQLDLSKNCFAQVEPVREEQLEKLRWKYKKPKGTVICLHGWQTDKRLLAAGLSHMLAAEGYRVVMADMRGHGLSTGDWVTFGARERYDLMELIDCLEQADLLEGGLGILGYSMGAAVAIQTAGLDDRVDVVIAMEPYTSLEKAAPEFGWGRFGLLMLLVGEDGVLRFIRRAGEIAGVDLFSYPPIEAIADTKAAVLLIHGKEDKHISSEHSRQLADRAGGPSEVVLIEGQGHFNLGLTQTYVLRDMMAAWLDRFLEHGG